MSEIRGLSGLKDTLSQEGESLARLQGPSPMNLLKNKLSILKEGKDHLNASLLLGPQRFFLPRV